MGKTYGSGLSHLFAMHEQMLSGSALGPIVMQQAGSLNKRDRTWLDLCCGCGALLAFARANGFQVTGVDAASGPLQQAKRIAPQAKLIRGDVAAVNLKNRFDIITCVGGSTNYLLRLNDLLRVLGHARRHLAEGGMFCFDVNTPHGYAINVDHPVSLVGDDHAGFFGVEYNARTQRAKWHVTGFVKSGRAYQRFDECHELRGYEMEQIDRLCERAGLSFERYDADTLAAADAETARLVYFCR